MGGFATYCDLTTSMGSITYINLLQNSTIWLYLMVLQYMFDTPPGGKIWEMHISGLGYFEKTLHLEKHTFIGKTVD